MKTITVKPKNKKEFAFIMEFFKRLKIDATIKKVKVSEGDKTKKQILDSIEQGYKEAQLHAAGKLKLKTAKELLDEL